MKVKFTSCSEFPAYLPKVSFPYDTVLHVSEEEFRERLKELEEASSLNKAVLGSPFLHIEDDVFVVTVYNYYQE